MVDYVSDLIFFLIYVMICSIIGAVLIVIGLYIVLWGKGKEAVKVAELPANENLDVVIVPGKSEPQGELELKGKKDEGGLPQEEP